jgi:predicted RNA polymerase sigma factor
MLIGERIMADRERSTGQKLTDMGQKWNKAKPTKATTFWIVLGAIVLVLYLGFSRGGWVTDSTSQTRADTSVEAAVIARLVPICLAQFNQDPEKDQKLVAFQELTNGSRRSTFVKDQGWATMPGEAEADSKVALECGNQIKLMNE